MQEISEGRERVINVRDIDPRHRHGIICQLFDHLDPESSLGPRSATVALPTRGQAWLALRLVLP